MRNTILGVIGVLWGGGIIVSGLAKGIPTLSNAHGSAAFVAFLFGLALVAAGSWALLHRRRRSDF
jgi:hypothetical protein